MVGEVDSLDIWKHCECGFAVAFLDSGKLYWFWMEGLWFSDLMSGNLSLSFKF